MTVLEYVKKSAKRLSKKVEDIKEVQQLYEDRVFAKKIALETAQKNGWLVYGGSAIDDMLPADEKLYNYPFVGDVDIMCPDPEPASKELAWNLHNSGIAFVESRPSRANDGTYNIKGMHIGSIADVSFIDINAFNALKRKSTKEPFVPYEYTLCAFHCEFSQPHRSPERHSKLLYRFGKLFAAAPFIFDPLTLQKDVTNSGVKSKKKVLSAMKKAGLKKPFVGVSASLESLGLEPIAEFEVLSDTPLEDAQMLSLEPARITGTSSGLQGLPEEHHITLEGRSLRVQMSFLKNRYCHHYVEIGKNELRGGAHTLLYFLFMRLLFDDEVQVPLVRSVIGALYQELFTTNVPPKALRTFEEDARCLGPTRTFHEAIQSKFQQAKALPAYWPWRDKSRTPGPDAFDPKIQTVRRGSMDSVVDLACRKPAVEASSPNHSFKRELW
ncbi:hypothetical protein CEUSTIGMA_g12566.t1 [Chlamydomonas eustigma]|uniref:Poly(A) polymerase catalytic subunit domain-containing protein n=1 Tax=Chlamydomonas eustigma TaxID=1157962 RepID=A0A250XPZ8_9CHLO|nr:hypothetical protein CEUSTIGMA_g12566.t1 [Chlamydomonas eustigma]|eukprot:GAX85147.1 hypothetical protein CEUSTIGMA_g12566.t1 [Chlamydomonas eustigma]